jgi:hypothetical protein
MILNILRVYDLRVYDVNETESEGI